MLQILANDILKDISKENLASLQDAPLFHDHTRGCEAQPLATFFHPSGVSVEFLYFNAIALSGLVHTVNELPGITLRLSLAVILRPFGSLFGCSFF
jgi:hypothetical protein